MVETVSSKDLGGVVDCVVPVPMSLGSFLIFAAVDTLQNEFGKENPKL